MKKRKKLLSILGINTFMAVKNSYNKCIDKNDFYHMITRRLIYQTPEHLADFLKHELLFHFKEITQYQ